MPCAGTSSSLTVCLVFAESGLTATMEPQEDPRAVRKALAIWWVNIIASLVLTLMSAAASVYLYLLLAGTVTQPAPLDREETAGTAFLTALIAVVFGALTAWLIAARVRMPRAARIAAGRAWLGSHHS